MKKIKVLVIAPIMPHREEIKFIAPTLSFLEPYCNIDWVDPLSVIDNALKNDLYYMTWQQQMVSHLENYEAFIGFSFGGVILQQCFPLFEKQAVPIMLFSTPTVADCALKQKLSTVTTHLQQGRTVQALSSLYDDVFYPHPPPLRDWSSFDHNRVKNRLITGLTRVLTTDASDLIKTSEVNHLHLIGEHSNLVNHYNVIPPKNGRLITVPDAGMRVLQDNLLFCQKEILEFVL